MAISSRPYTFDRVVRILAGVALLAGAIWLVNSLRNVLLPFCVACLIAYLLEPVVELLQKLLHLKGRVIATLLTLIGVTAIVVLLGHIFVPSVVKEIHQIEEILHTTSDSDVAVPFVPDNIIEPVRKWASSIDLGDLLDNSHFQSLLNQGTSFVAATVEFLLHTLEWLLTFVYVIFILIDYPSLMTNFRMLVPKKYRRVVYRVEDDMKNSMNLYFRGQILIAACAAVFYCIGFSIVGIPLAIVLGLLVGILYIIPYFQYVTLIPVTLVCLIDSMSGSVHFWSELGQCLLVYVVSQCICDYILTPKIMGKTMGLNPAIILLALSVWGSLLGLIGMIIALPMTTILLAYYKEYIIDGGDSSPSDKQQAQDAFRQVTEAPKPPLKS
ncbi:AI-2E family transporter [uncultured Muribaculum sp.]|uniref:AI-2E family transporter n=1 Tax=uncultured Muribaculum sp. TaxID=1918613 RepID=UPI0025D39440|nr:AI-2E family transporter [uncultured Muribaculum sp.]